MYKLHRGTRTEGIIYERQSQAQDPAVNIRYKQASETTREREKRGKEGDRDFEKV